jgi:hypothetical protein
LINPEKGTQSMPYRLFTDDFLTSRLVKSVERFVFVCTLAAEDKRAEN